jgi:hypothetical protein
MAIHIHVAVGFQRMLQYTGWSRKVHLVLELSMIKMIMLGFDMGVLKMWTAYPVNYVKTSFFS